MSEQRRPRPSKPIDEAPALPASLISAVAPTKSERLMKRLLGVAVAAGIVAVLALGFALSAKHDADQANSAKGTANSQAQRLYSQAASAGVTPVATPSGVGSPSVVTGPPGASGAVGPGPTDGQIAAAVAVYCVQHSGCVGVPSAAQVRAAVTAYCATGACRGHAGATGPSGVSGAPGAAGASGAAGKDGTTPSAADIAAAVTAYCSAHGSCTGPAGPKGDTGATGSAGRGIASVDCSGLGIDQLVVHYDDGTSESVACNATQPTTGAS